MKRKKVTGFIKDKACPSDPIAFYDEMTGFTDEGKGVDVVCSEPFFFSFCTKVFTEAFLVAGAFFLLSCISLASFKSSWTIVFLTASLHYWTVTVSPRQPTLLPPSLLEVS